MNDTQSKRLWRVALGLAVIGASSLLLASYSTRDAFLRASVPATTALDPPPTGIIVSSTCTFMPAGRRGSTPCRSVMIAEDWG